MPAKAIAKPSTSTTKRTSPAKPLTSTTRRTTTAAKPESAEPKRAVKKTATVTSKTTRVPSRSPAQAKSKVATKARVPQVRKGMDSVVPPAPVAEVARNNKKDKLAKPKKTKLVRDSFTMPDSEYALIATLKKRCLTAGLAAKKSEILRAAIAQLDKLTDAVLVAAMRRLEVIKTGRPAKERK